MTPRKPTPGGRRAGAGTVRIIGGQWRRRTLVVVDTPGLRPTPDRVRETLFNWLSDAFDGVFEGRSALDLFAGSGALGFEAASRGAAPVVVVDSDRRACAALKAAEAMLSATGIDVVRGDATTVAATLYEAGDRFDVVFLDPPFGSGFLDALLPTAATLCRPHGFVYAESEKALAAARIAAVGLSIHRSDKAGEVFYYLLRRNI